MKRSLTTMAVLIGSAVAVMAQGSVGPFFALLSDSGTGVGGGIRCDWMFNETFGIDGRVAYVVDDDVAIIPALLGVTVQMPMDTVTLYATAGGGYFIHDYTGDADIPEPDDAIGFFGGVGLKAPLSESMKFFADVLYVSAESETTETKTGIWRVPGGIAMGTRRTTVTWDLSGPLVSAGVVWTF